MSLLEKSRQIMNELKKNQHKNQKYAEKQGCMMFLKEVYFMLLEQSKQAFLFMDAELG